MWYRKCYVRAWLYVTLLPSHDRNFVQLLNYQHRLPVKNIWPGCCAPGSCMTVWRQPLRRLSHAFGQSSWHAPWAASKGDWQTLLLITCSRISQISTLNFLATWGKQKASMIKPIQTWTFPALLRLDDHLTVWRDWKKTKGESRSEKHFEQTLSSVVSSPALAVYFMKSLRSSWYFMILWTGLMR